MVDTKEGRDRSEKKAVVPPGFVELPHQHDFRESLCRMLESTQMLADFKRSEIEVIVDYVHGYQIHPGVKVFQEGRREEFLCFIIRGKINILKDPGTGEHKLLSTVSAGKTIGEMSLIDGLPHSATAIAAEPCVLLLLSSERLADLSQKRPEVAVKVIMKIAKLLSLRLRQTSGKLVNYL